MRASLNNGVVYIAKTNDLNTQRAITLLGATSSGADLADVLKTGACDKWN